MKKVEIDFHGNKFGLESGKIAKLANGAVVVTSGDSLVLVTACIGNDRGGDFLPLTIDYVEKTYAAGKIPGGFIKREGRLGEREILACRLIDRPCRPMFPKGYGHEIQVIATVMSADDSSDTALMSVVGASAALTLSEAPFQGPIAAVRVVRVDGELLINPGFEKQKKADLDYIVAGTKDAIVMVEGGSEEVPEKDILDAIFYAHQELQPLIKIQEELQDSCGKEKASFTPAEVPANFKEKVKSFLSSPVKELAQIPNKLERSKATSNYKKQLIEECQSFKEELGEEQFRIQIDKHFHKELSNEVRRRVLDDGIRIDGRDTKTVRPISIELGLLPRTHGSALFTRGETQGLVVVTLGTSQEVQRVDNLADDEDKSFFLHYNFTPFSVGETRPVRGPGRREIGHGALAERALKVVTPDTENFPYVTRIVAEITQSNGSTSMATVCGGSLAMMQAGVPIKAPVAGIAMGLLKEDDNYAILTDILGDEDHLGDMDFKVCGTEAGVTAMQMDIKISGLSKKIFEEALSQAKDARLHILSEMNKAISTPEESMSEFAPKIVTISINPDKIRDIIGPGGKMIRSISESCNVKIDIDDDGTVTVAGEGEKNVNSAIEIIEGITEEVVIGKLYEGVVKKVMDFGAFVEVIPNTDGLVHISQLADHRVKRVEDVVNEGDIIWVKVLDIDSQGKIRLSYKEALAEMDEDSEEEEQEES